MKESHAAINQGRRTRNVLHLRIHISNYESFTLTVQAILMISTEKES